MAEEPAPTCRFRAVIKLDPPNPYVEVPLAVAEAFLPWARSRRIIVEGELDRTPIRATLVPVRGGGHRMYVNGGMRSAAGVGVGDEVTLALRPTHREEVQPRPDVSEALRVAGVEAAFEALAPSHRREWLRHIDDARSAPTRARRVAAAVAALAGAAPQARP